jgi:hypothetical protein
MNGTILVAFTIEYFIFCHIKMQLIYSARVRPDVSNCES